MDRQKAMALPATSSDWYSMSQLDTKKEETARLDAER